MLKKESPLSKTFLTADWRHLAVFNFECDPNILEPHLPKGVELDDWQGQHLVSIVAFLFLNTKIKGIKIPFHSQFEEINLRFYVKRYVDDTWRRGVVFIKEVVPKFWVAQIANKIYNENYIQCQTAHQHKKSNDNHSMQFQYSWNDQNQNNQLQIETSSHSQTLSSNSCEEFILEHYFGYTTQKDGGTLEYAVHHPRWRVLPIKSYSYALPTASHFYGTSFANCLKNKPHSVMLAEGSEVSVSHGVRIK